MSAVELRKEITAVPFRPFTVNVADGRRIPVVGQDFIFVSPAGRTAHVYLADGSYEKLDMLLITGVSFGPPAPSPTAGNQAANP